MRRGLALLLAAAASASATGDLRGRLAQRAPVHGTVPGALARLELPPAVLGDCRPDLADLRLLGADGSEIPFVVDSGLGSRPAGDDVRETRSLRLSDVRREEQRRPDGPTRWHERFELLADPAPSGDWELVVDTRAASFVRRLQVHVTREGHTQVPLVEDASIFRLQDPIRERLRVPLGTLPERLVVTIDGEGDAFLDPTFRVETRRDVPPIRRLALALPVSAQRRERGRTIIDLERPPGLMPDVLRIETSTPAFSRLVEVFDTTDRDRGERIGQAIVTRTHAGETTLPDELELRRGYRHRLLRVVVTDQDSPPLADLRVVAMVRLPTLVFVAPAGPLHLYFGGGRTPPARYDVARLAEPWGAEPGAATARASLGALEPNPDFDGRPRLEFAMRAGAAVDARLYSHRRTLTVPPSPEGVTYLTLGVEDLANTRVDLADVRVVDGERRGWPYLVRHDAERTWHAVAATRVAEAPGRSRYEIALPAVPLRLDRLSLAPAVPFFDRPYRLLGAAGDAERVLASGRLVRRGRETEPRETEPHETEPMVLEIGAERLDRLALVIDDGDERPLAFATLRVRTPLPRLQLVAPAGTYTLLVGHPEARAPRYDVAGLREMIADAPTLAAAATPLVENPAFRAVARLHERGGITDTGSRVLVWTVLVGALLVLSVVTLRLVRRDGTSTGA